jgi:hypothetical protein
VFLDVVTFLIHPSQHIAPETLSMNPLMLCFPRRSNLLTPKANRLLCPPICGPAWHRFIFGPHVLVQRKYRGPSVHAKIHPVILARLKTGERHHDHGRNHHG